MSSGLLCAVIAAVFICIRGQHPGWSHPGCLQIIPPLPPPVHSLYCSDTETHRLSLPQSLPPYPVTPPLFPVLLFPVLLPALLSELLFDVVSSLDVKLTDWTVPACCAVIV